MSNTDKGILIFYEWIESILDLKLKDQREILKAMYEYQRFGKKPPEFSGPAKILARVIFPCIDRRIAGAVNGRRSAEARSRRAFFADGEQFGDSDCKSSSESNSAPASKPATDLATNPATDLEGDPSTKEKNSKVKKNKENYNISIEERIVGSADEDKIGYADHTDIICSADIPDERARKKEIINEEKNCFGRHGNVLLTESEYRQLSDKIPQIDEYLDSFSEKLHSRGYRYNDHFKAILEWWERDRILPQARPQERRANPPSMYDDSHWQEFFERAVARSLDD